MNKSLSLLDSLQMSDLVYSDSQGLKLLRFGALHNRFDTSDSFHYNKPPEARGTWASIYPYKPVLHFPDQHDGRILDISDQTDLSKRAFSNSKDNPFLKPITFFWKKDIYSHIDKTGSYRNKGWTRYQTTAELVQVIRNNYPRIKGTVSLTRAKSQNVNFPDTDIRYFENHEYEVFVPHEQIAKSH